MSIDEKDGWKMLAILVGLFMIAVGGSCIRDFKQSKPAKHSEIMLCVSNTFDAHDKMIVEKTLDTYLLLDLEMKIDGTWKDRTWTNVADTVSMRMGVGHYKQYK